MPQAIFWLWLHLLQFDVSNQSLSPEEDEQNKRWRPLPSKRLSVRQARVLRWLLVPICLIVSARYSLQIFGASLSLITFTLIYNELAGHSHWFVRNVVNACGAASFEVGTTLLACKSLILHSEPLTDPDRHPRSSTSRCLGLRRSPFHNAERWNKRNNDPGAGLQRRARRSRHRPSHLADHLARHRPLYHSRGIDFVVHRSGLDLEVGLGDGFRIPLRRRNRCEPLPILDKCKGGPSFLLLV